MDTRAREQGMQPDLLPRYHYRRVGQTLSWAGPALQPWTTFHRNRAMPIRYRKLSDLAQAKGDQASLPQEEGQGASAKRSQRAANHCRQQTGGGLEPKSYVGYRQRSTRGWPALALVGREERLWIHRCWREGEFPSQVHGVLDAYIHPLTSGWRKGVGGVAR